MFIILVVIHIVGRDSLDGSTNRKAKVSGVCTAKAPFTIACTVVAVGIGQVVDRIVCTRVQKGARWLMVWQINKLVSFKRCFNWELEYWYLSLYNHRITFQNSAVFIDIIEHVIEVAIIGMLRCWVAIFYGSVGIGCITVKHICERFLQHPVWRSHRTRAWRFIEHLCWKKTRIRIYFLESIAPQKKHISYLRCNLFLFFQHRVFLHHSGLLVYVM